MPQGIRYSYLQGWEGELISPLPRSPTCPSRSCPGIWGWVRPHLLPSHGTRMVVLARGWWFLLVE